jgi:hypothetical protein
MGHKKIIDSVYERNYNKLISFSRVQIDKFSRNYDEYMVVAECYEFLINYKSWKNDIIKTDDIMKMSYLWIKNNVKWEGSFLQSRKLKDIEKIDKEEGDEEDFYYGLENKDINISLIHNIIEDFEKTLNIYDRGLWEIWHHKALQNSKDIASYLNMSKSSGYLIVNQCKEVERRFRDYLDIKWIW